MKAIAERLCRSGFADLHAKVREGRRLDFDDGLRLYRTPDLTAVGCLANLARERRSGDRTYFVRNLHIDSKGSVFMAPRSERERLVTDAGFVPARRNTAYEILPRPAAPATRSAA